MQNIQPQQTNIPVPSTHLTVVTTREAQKGTREELGRLGPVHAVVRTVWFWLLKLRLPFFKSGELSALVPIDKGALTSGKAEKVRQEYLTTLQRAQVAYAKGSEGTTRIWNSPEFQRVESILSFAAAGGEETSLITLRDKASMLATATHELEEFLEEALETESLRADRFRFKYDGELKLSHCCTAYPEDRREMRISERQWEQGWLAVAQGGDYDLDLRCECDARVRVKFVTSELTDLEPGIGSKHSWFENNGTRCFQVLTLWWYRKG